MKEERPRERRIRTTVITRCRSKGCIFKENDNCKLGWVSISANNKCEDYTGKDLLDVK